ncbi:PAAR-like domain-containing protein [Pseudoduganella lutea]|uniref:DUF4150 domain-containing protein n=1 Tax=Pseudoduganella lutea TaxID=321985 RepID=A0A4P6L4M1_9BURK|nr:PAAR-like domain-containing protein [Pseudoduganella lutea]QBE66539.1 DUF4150 domain-containing protein [Pseudoduganella lutea]
MQTHVYANDQEIACKAAGSDGVSPQAFPDPCWSPPGPPAGPIVIPYPNTCFADSITNGTSTVFVCGKEVAIEDQSYFSTSTGNEPATRAFRKGVATGVITGKAYFTQWSFDVVFEGFGVPRNDDLVSHNHGSQPGNTPLFPYISRSFFSSFPCKKEEAAIKRACAPESEHSESKKEIKSKSSLARLLRSKRRPDGKKEHWTKEHCDGLEMSVGKKVDAKKYIEDMKHAVSEIPKELKVLDAMKAELEDMVKHAAMRAGGKWALKAGAKQLGGSAVPLAGNIAMGLWSIYDAGTSIADVYEIRKVAAETLVKLDILRSRLPEINALRERFANFDNLSAKEQEKELTKLAADAQDTLATLNDCVRARKCNLVPYTSETQAPPNKNIRTEPATGDKGGCCEGQTGHHLLPEKSLEGTCPKYNHGTAPTVCVEGVSQNHGSHQRAHVALAREHEALNRAGRVDANSTMSMSDAIDAGTRSHQRAFSLSRCSQKCIRTQLANYYNAICSTSARPIMLDAQAKPVASEDGPD